MNRVIKFRVWDKDEEKMDYNVGLVGNRILFEYGDIESDDSSVEAISYVDIDEHNEKYFEIMQYTGLKDKNDKEIYEGDIIEITWSYDKSIHKFKVYYDCENAYYSLKEIGRDDLDVLCGYSKGQIEVIGNIYENPELLKE
jgi:uncharacterized phage protein (TIGR01671 family)